jgi:hypothetical protein
MSRGPDVREGGLVVLCTHYIDDLYHMYCNHYAATGDMIKSFHNYFILPPRA